MSRNPLASKLYNNFILRLKAERDLDIYRNKFEFTFNELKKLRTYITEHFSERKLNVEILEKINLLIKHNELEKRDVVEILSEIRQDNRIIKNEIIATKEKAELLYEEIQQLKGESKSENDRMKTSLTITKENTAKNNELICKIDNNILHLQKELENIRNIITHDNDVPENEPSYIEENYVNSPIEDAINNTSKSKNIWHAILNGSLPSVKYWIENEPDCINKVASYKYHFDTPLQLAAFEGQCEISRFLLANGAEIHAKHRNEFNTPLHFAVLMGHFNVVKCLISQGANFNISNKINFRPLHFACQKGHFEIAKFLISKGATINVTCKFEHTSPMHLAASKGYFNIVEHLGDLGANLEITDINLNTPLHLASSKGRIDIVKYLIAKGVNLEAKQIEEFTPLHLACIKGFLDIAQILLENGANFTSKNKNNNTPLHLAAYNGRLEVVKFLVNKGANFREKNSYNECSIKMAQYRNHTSIIKFLSSRP